MGNQDHSSSQSQPVSALLGADWKAHDGRYCPVHEDVQVKPWFRVDDLFAAEQNGFCPAKALRWDHLKGHGAQGWGDIVAYRLADGPLEGQDGHVGGPGMTPSNPAPPPQQMSTKGRGS